ncbi:MAG: hypothetical protein AB8H86_21385 [Polyangiales bacterium]
MGFSFHVSMVCLLLAWSAAPALGQVDEGSVPVAEEVAEEAGALVQPDAEEPAEPYQAPHEVEGAEHLSSAGGVTERPVYTSSSERRRRLIFVAEGREALLNRLTLQLPDWQVRQVAVEPTYLRVWRARAQLMPGDVVVWIEVSDDVARVALLDGSGDAPRSSSLPAAEDDEEWSRAFALVVEGLIREQVAANQEAGRPTHSESTGSREHLLDVRVYGRPMVQARPRRRRSWMRSPMERKGWLFRFGWTQGFAPRQRTERWGASFSIYPTGGLRVAGGRWLHRNVRMSITGDFAWTGGEPEGALGLQMMLVSSSRLRIGGGLEATALIVSERDTATGNRFGWVGYRFGVPIELGIEVNGHGGIFFNLGPTFTKAPYLDSFQLGYQLSLEWEFN